MGRWTASRFIEITRGGARADVTADVVALSDAADIYAVRIEMLEAQLAGAVALLREVADLPLAFEDDERLKWVEVQIDRPTWDALAAYRSQ